MANYKKLGKDILLMTLGSMGSRLISFLIVPFYTAVLTTEEYGTADLITTTVSLLFPFFSLIICEAMMRFALEKDVDQREVWRIGCKISLVGIIAFLVLSPIVLLTPLKEYYWLVVAYFVTFNLNQALSYFTRGINQTKIYAISGTLQTVLIVGANLIFLLWLKIGVVGYLLAHIIAALLSTVFMLVASHSYRFGFDLRHTDRDLEKRMLKYSLPLIPNSISWWLSNSSGRFILTGFVGAAANGIFAVAYKIPTVLSMMTSIFGHAWKLSAADDFGSDSSKKFFEDIFSKLAALLLMVTSLLIVINKPLAAILFSKDFYQAWQCVPLLLISAVFHGYSEFFGAIYTSAYKTRFIFISTGIGALVNVALSFLLIPRFHVMGAAFATMISHCTIFICRIINSRKLMKLRYHWVRDGICYALIAAQIVVACNSFAFEYLISGVIFLAVVFMMRGEVASLAKMMLGKVFKKIKR